MSIKSKKTRETLRILQGISHAELTLGALLNAIRKCEEWTQTEFAEKLDVSKQYMCDLECGRRFVRPKTAANFAQKLGYAENQFVRLCLQDMVNKDGIKLQVDVKPRVSLPRRNYSPQKQKHG